MDDLINLLREEGAKPVFLTGAGISRASGIATFRGDEEDAVWSAHSIQMATYDHYMRHPHEVWDFYIQRFRVKAEPNPAHFALAEIERRIPATRVITQNVDGLHLAAGTKSLVEIHGSSRKVRCTKRTCKNGGPRYFLDWDDTLIAGFDPTDRKSVPRCPHCRKQLRPHVLWFDEYYLSHEDYGYQRALGWLEEATVMVYVGTSFSVGVTNTALQVCATEDIPEFLIDPRKDPDVFRPSWIPGKAEEILPELIEALA